MRRDKMNLQKIRTVITTDGEIDDMNSFVRLLLYSNEIELQGIILTSSIFHYSGDEFSSAYRWTGETWPLEIIESYAKDYPNLKMHAKDYPTPEYLKDIFFVGNITAASEMEKITPGSQRIKELILDNDSRKLYLQAWGGTNTIARALKSIEEEYKDSKDWLVLKKAIEEKVVLYMILEQDDTFQEYIRPIWQLKVISDDMNFGYFAYGWKNLAEDKKEFFESEWFKKNIIGKGHLLSKYALIGDGKYIEGEREEDQFSDSTWLKQHPEFQRYDFISEGDSLAFLYLLHPSFAGIENPTFGGWSGRYKLKGDNHFISEAVDYNPNTQRFEQEYNFIRWLPDVQSDFAARAKWTISSKFEQANHYPKIHLTQTEITAHPGEVIEIHVQVTDPNELPLNYRWWCYYEASSYWNFENIPLRKEYFDLGEMKFPFSNHSEKITKDWHLKMEGATTNHVHVYIPQDAKAGDTFHLIFEVSNKCETPLKSYQRIIITIH